MRENKVEMCWGRRQGNNNNNNNNKKREVDTKQIWVGVVSDGRFVSVGRNDRTRSDQKTLQLKSSRIEWAIHSGLDHKREVTNTLIHDLIASKSNGRFEGTQRHRSATYKEAMPIRLDKHLHYFSPAFMLMDDQAAAEPKRREEIKSFMVRSTSRELWKK
jgi:hypothetical protein